jgi:phage terminase Nu1 subunit (DNA packaging protein)
MAMPIHEREMLEKKTVSRQKSKKVQEETAKLQARAEKIVELRHRQERLVERLDTGAALIEEKRARGDDVTQYEDFWIQLLRDYEAVCEQLHEIEFSEVA